MAHMDALSSRPDRGARDDGQGPHRRRQVSRYIYNWLSLSGLALIVIALFAVLTVVVVEVNAHLASAYLGIVYLLLLSAMAVGVVMVPIGMLLERRAQLRGVTSIILGQWAIDFTKRSHRNTVVFFLLGGLCILLGGGVGTYKAYHLTEKTSFCGQLCHTVMRPEWVTYQNSAHARVKCVECHIGSGAGWYIRSKIAGVRQVIAVARDTFPRPIPTPISNLRPARETCEECHWPGKFIGYREMVNSYYRADEQNSRHRLRMLIKIGGEKEGGLGGGGIHYHMLRAGRIEYIARDEKRQDIPLVRIQRRDGGFVEFNDSSAPLTDDEKARLPVRVMDCMDCHNRPAHQFRPPMELVNESMAAGAIPAALPYIKREAVRVLDAEYADTPTALVEIETRLRNFYQEYADAADRDLDGQLAAAIKEIQAIYQRAVFPEMKVAWRNYPNNLGHREWPGCFRCHNEQMESADGSRLFTRCNSCHLILAQGPEADAAAVDFREGLPFYHPGDGEYMDEFTDCAGCHAEGGALYGD